MQSTNRKHVAVTSLAVAVLLLAASNWSRASYMWSVRNMMAHLSTSAPTHYLASVAGAWGCAWTIAAVGLWRQARWARKLTLYGVVIYQVHNWTSRWFFGASNHAMRRWPLEAILSVLCIFVIWAILLSPRVKKQFVINHKGKVLGESFSNAFNQD